MNKITKFYFFNRYGFLTIEILLLVYVVSGFLKTNVNKENIMIALFFFVLIFVSLLLMGAVRFYNQADVTLYDRGILFVRKGLKTFMIRGDDINSIWFKRYNNQIGKVSLYHIAIVLNNENVFCFTYLPEKPFTYDIIKNEENECTLFYKCTKNFWNIVSIEKIRGTSEIRKYY
jgi:hypothetical protein